MQETESFTDSGRQRVPELLSEPGALKRLGFLPDLLCRLFLSQIRLDPGAVDHIRDLSARGSVVYVMRYRSLVDYMLVAFLLLQEGLPLPEFVSDVPSLLLRPIGEIVRTLWGRLRQFRWSGATERHIEDRHRCQKAVHAGSPILIFMRTRAPGLRWSGTRRMALRRVRSGTDYLREIVHAGSSGDREVFLVPLAILRGRGFRRKESRLATIVYSVQEAPGEFKRLLSLLWNSRDSSITVGRHVQLSEFEGRYGHEGQERLVRRLARALQIFLYREEKLVWGPTLLPKRRVRERVLQSAEIAALVRRLAQETRQPESRLWRRAERYFDEMAANYQGMYFGVLEFVFNRIWPRIFQGFDYRGLERVVDRVKEHPVVLVPCHRSHFDYLILSYLFHLNHISPPHIAAGINLSFWPLGPLFRGAGAFFIRRSFEDNELYKLVFRNYLKFLIREGYTQEFFIEGGRSRTGKILTPKMGMLSAIVNAFVDGVRRDLYFVPISIQYGRVVEEDSYQRELVGAEKEKESLLGLLRARTLLRQKRGTVHVTFAEPISLADTLGDRKERFARSDDPLIDEERRRFTQKLGFRILRSVNDVALAGATAVCSTVLLSSPKAAWKYTGFVQSARTLLKILRHQKVAFTASLERNQEDFRENLEFLEKGRLIELIHDNEGTVIHVPPEKRMILNFYKNNTIHFFLLPALLSRGLLRGLSNGALQEEIHGWLDLYRWEFALPEREEISTQIGEWLEYYRQEGALRITDGGESADQSHPLLEACSCLLDDFDEAYWMVARTVAQLGDVSQPLGDFFEQVRKRYATAALLGEVTRPEGNSSVTLENAINRFAEMGLVLLEGRGKERMVRRGPQAPELQILQERLRGRG